jgi:predicted ATPase
MGDVPQRFQVLQGLWSWYLIRAEFETARDLAEHCLHLTQSLPQPRLLLLAHAALGVTLLVLGELLTAREHLQQGMRRYNAEPAPRQQATQDPGVSCLAHTALALWLQGYPDQAQQRLQEALALARTLPHPVSTVCALIFAARLHQLRQEHQAAQERAEAAITLATAQGLPHWVAQGTAWRGWALAQQGQVEEGIAQIRQGLAAYQATGAELARPALLALLAEAYGKAGQAVAGLAAVADAFAIVHRDAAHHHCEAELYRLKGELLLQSRGQRPEATVSTPHVALHTPHVEEAEACLQQALATARRQQAKSLELRAAISLGRLWQQQGKRHDAHQMLAEVCGWFGEGLDTADHTAARALLAALA